MTLSSDANLSNAALAATLSSALNAYCDGFAIYNQNDTLIYCNDAFARLFDLTPDALLHRQHQHVIQHVFEQSKYIDLNSSSLQELMTTFRQGWRQSPIRSYEIVTANGGSYLITEQITEDQHVICSSMDIAHRQQLEKRLENTENQLNAILNNAPALISIVDTSGRILVANQQFGQLELAQSSATGHSYFDLFPPEYAENLWANHNAVVNDDGMQETEEVLPHGDGRDHSYLSIRFPLKTDQGKTFGICNISTDITERKLSENRIHETEQQLRTLVQHAPEAVIILDVDKNKIIEVNNSAELLFGLDRAELRRIAPLELSPKYQNDGQLSQDKNQHFIAQALEGKTPVFEWIHLNARGEEIPCEARLVQLPKQGANWIRGSITNISERKAAELLLNQQREHLHFLAHHDALTHLPNRRLLLHRLEDAINEAHRYKTQFAVILIDLDRFKYINDTLGHDQGDEFLTITAERLKQLVSRTDTASRLGGDEFVVLMKQIEHHDQIADQANLFLQELAKPIDIAGHKLHTTLSIGISVYPNDGKTPESLVKNADAAMYMAKEQGKNHFQFYTADLDNKLKHLLQLENALRSAISQQQFRLVYQPQWHSETNQCFGVETLIRWYQPGHGIVAPNHFIPLAEETGIIVEIGEWTLLKACMQFQAWRAQSIDISTIAVNISPRQFHQPHFIDMVKNVIAKSGIPPRALQLELTETIVMEDANHAVEKLQELTALGVTLALDDFGTGYSSLSYLKRFPIQKLKIDQSFVRDIATDSNDAAIVRSVIALAESMNLEVIAEGVETHEQKQFLECNNCTQMQGYLFAAPLSANEFEKFYRNTQATLGN